MKEYFNYLEIHDRGIEQSLSNLNLEDANYYDPDSYSPDLYKDLQRVFRNRTFPNGYTIVKTEVTYSYPSYGLQLSIANCEKNVVYIMNMGADYFGISKKWLANRSKFTFDEIKDMLKTSRLLGGHMLFPRNVKNLSDNEYIGGLPSVNTARGGRPMFDRTDLFLLDLKNYYNNQSFRLKALSKYKCFFDLFIDFNNFIDFFNLNDFVNSEYQIINLLTDKPFSDSENLVENSELLYFPVEKNEAKELVKNSCQKILLRTKMITNDYKLS